jgi:hypothetical protein
MPSYSVKNSISVAMFLLAVGREVGLTLGKIVCEVVIRRAGAVAPAEKDHC